jgi:hypothetical protein
LQPSGCSCASKSSSNYGNTRLAFHAGPPRNLSESDPMAPTTQSKRSVRQRAPKPGTAPRADQLSHIRSTMSVTLVWRARPDRVEPRQGKPASNATGPLREAPRGITHASTGSASPTSDAIVHRVGGQLHGAAIIRS